MKADKKLSDHSTIDNINLELQDRKRNREHESDFIGG